MRTFAKLAAIAVAVMALAGAAQAQAADPAGVQFQKLGHGWRLADAKGMTLYTFARDHDPTKSACTGGCAKQWPPLAAAAEDKAEGDWAKLTRDDGSLQWAYRGAPLYAYSKDVNPGDINGDEINNVWNVAFKEITMPAGFTVMRTLVGWAIADKARMTLYASDADTGKKVPGCDVACARTWQPVEAPWVAVPEGDWSVVVRADGTHQWAYKGRPLYRYSGDGVIADALGDGVDKKWHALVLEPPPPVPAWVTVQASDSGDLFADPSGKTLYAHDGSQARGRDPALVTSDILRPEDWKPMLADAEAKPVGSWTILTNKDGTRQWAYRGLALYTNVLEKTAGELRGVRRPDKTWKTIMRNGKQMDGTGA